ncbi:MAG: phosphoribosyltransferase [Treponema sp.]|jgi:hypothetical protein|nr:phosphoribosyltransferase [Treponema sp.]
MLDMKIRRELLIEILDRIPEKPIFEKMFDFYRKIFLQKPDLVVCMSRKSWCVIHLFLPLLEAEGIAVDRKKLTHDRMVHPWFSELYQLDPDKHGQIKVFVIDDTFQTGRALDDCVRRLKCVYGVDEKNLTVAVFAMTDDEHKINQHRIDKEKGLYTVFFSPSRPGIQPFQVNWGSRDAFYTKEDISAFSNFFVEALHACSEPYVGYIPAFRLPIKDVQDFFGANKENNIELGNVSAIRIPGYLEQDDLKAPLNDPAVVGYYNITSETMRKHDIEAFYILLPDDVETFYIPALNSSDKNDLSFLPSKHALSIGALRFYLNSKTGIALMVPYLSLKDCYAEKDIVEKFPKELQPLLKKMQAEKWEEREEQLAAYRLLRYASGYLWGKYVFKQWFGRDVKDEDIVSYGGICSERFFNWINGPSAVQDLTYIWSFFAPEKNNVVEETQSLELDGEAGLKNVIGRDLHDDDKKYFRDVIIESLTMPGTVDYYGTVSMMFRYIFERERERLDEYVNSNASEKNALAPPFHGFPIHTFFALLLLSFPRLKTRRDVLVTVTLMLCDTGIAVSQLCQHDNVIGTVLLNGEQSCHSLAPIAPEYARFLSEFPGLLRKCKKERRQEKFEMAKTEIQKYFEYERSRGFGRRLPLEQLMTPLEKIKTIVEGGPERKLDAYSVLPEDSFFDCSELFFSELREKLAT